MKNLKIYNFVHDGDEYNMQFPELVELFGGYKYNDQGAKIVPRAAMLIVKINEQGGAVTV